jgi:5-carboxymethyl-2-hydroxymuconate isomerase
MNEYHDKPLSDMTLEELINHLFHLGTLEYLQASYELDDFETAVGDVKGELHKRTSK